MSDAIDLIQRFCDDWGKGASVDEIVDYFTDDAIYHNIPVDPAVGRDAIKATFAMFTTGVERIEFRVINIAANGPVVLTERVDVFTRAGKTFDLRVMGAFEADDGKIKAWRDYYDPSQFQRKSP